MSPIGPPWHKIPKTDGLDPTYEDVTWHDGSKERIGKYEVSLGYVSRFLTEVMVEHGDEELLLIMDELAVQYEDEGSYVLHEMRVQSGHRLLQRNPQGLRRQCEYQLILLQSPPTLCLGY